MDILPRLALGLALSGLIGLLAYRRNALAPSGVAGAMLVGTLIFGFGGWTWGLTLIAFFVSSSLLSQYRRAEKQAVAEQFDKGQRRDLGQVLANGGLGALLALAVFFLIDLTGQVRAGNPLYIYLTVAYFGVMATVNADTWATELGVLARERPRLITTGRPAAPGTSGGITRYGTLAALTGAAFIGVTAFLLIQLASWATRAQLLLADLPIVAIAAVAGLVGSLFDSLLGATVQRIFWCDRCEKETERQVHSCGAPTRPLRGWSWMNNDMVNLLSSLVGGLLAGSLGLLILL
ncbi:MAG TPA: DUF92 domain-containing protein [Anaerolineae bacterium]|nr:DUF92 domain-containing protein [Anaerolineae bacterium]HNU05704.1 DUF92 domain-containing protein [Anaerolineae bacterium]